MINKNSRNWCYTVLFRTNCKKKIYTFLVLLHLFLIFPSLTGWIYRNRTPRCRGLLVLQETHYMDHFIPNAHSKSWWSKWLTLFLQTRKKANHGRKKINTGSQWRSHKVTRVHQWCFGFSSTVPTPSIHNWQQLQGVTRLPAVAHNQQGESPPPPQHPSWSLVFSIA